MRVDNGDTDTASEKYRYERHSWPEIRNAADNRKMVVVPTACVEDHGYHLPIDVDIEIITNLCRETAATRNDTLVYPSVDNGYDPHHMNFPGTVTLRHETFVDTLMRHRRSLLNYSIRRFM